VNVVDSSAWLEYFAAGPAADFFASAVETPEELVVPTVTLYEVFKQVARQRDEGDALKAITLMRQGTVVDLTGPLALDAARVSAAHRIPMSDSIILATAQAYGATLWTQDSHFAQIDGVRYIAKR